MSAVVEATSESLAALTSEGPLPAAVWGPSRVPCVPLSPHVERLAEERPDLRVLKLEAPKNRQLCIDMKVMGMPAFLLFRDGAEVARLSDPELTPDGLMSWLDDTLETLDPEGG